MNMMRLYNVWLFSHDCGLVSVCTSWHQAANCILFKLNFYTLTCKRSI
jgi:hypothetical protein